MVKYNICLEKSDKTLREHFTASGFWRWFSKSDFNKHTDVQSSSGLHECTFLHLDLLCFTGALRLLAFRSFFAGGKRDERWRRARPRISGDPRSKWSTKAIVTPGLWYVLGCWHHWCCGFIELISGRKEFALREKYSNVFFQRTEINTHLCLCVNLGSSYSNLGLGLNWKKWTATAC